MSKLFVALLGGTAPGATVELHDIVFVTGNSIQETYPQLKEKWFGSKKGVHLDCWMELTYADGYKIEVLPETSETNANPSLYFVNIGAYPLNRLEESHTYLFLVGESDQEIKARAKKLAPSDHRVPHKDNLVLVDDVIPVLIPGYRLQLTPTKEISAPHITSDYCPL